MALSAVLRATAKHALITAQCHKPSQRFLAKCMFANRDVGIAQAMHTSRRTPPARERVRTVCRTMGNDCRVPRLLRASCVLDLRLILRATPISAGMEARAEHCQELAVGQSNGNPLIRP